MFAVETQQASVPLSQAQAHDRIKAVIGVAFFHALIGYAFIFGLGVDVAGAIDNPLKLFEIASDPIPPPQTTPASEKSKQRTPRVKQARKNPEGSAAPPNLRSRPTEVVAPEPLIRLIVPQPIVAAPIAGPGAAATSGNAPVRGPGTGAGGQGNGTGSGAFGDGGGGGGGAGLARPASLIGADVRGSDYPKSAFDEGFEGIVYMRFVIDPRGRIGDCRVTRSSGHAGMDRETCRLMQKRLRYRPARDAQGRPVSDVTQGEQKWTLYRSPDRWIDADVPIDEGADPE